MRRIHAAAAIPFVLAAAVAACRSGSESPSAGGAAAPGTPAAGRPRVYVSNETAGTVAVIDGVTAEVIATIPVGKRPRGLRVSRDGTLLYVALSGSPLAPPGVDESTLPPPDRSADAIGVIDLAARKVVRTITSGQDPETFDLSPDGKRIYVSNEDSAEMSAIDIASGSVIKKVKVGEEPEGVTTSPDGRFVYVTCEGTQSVVAGTTEPLTPVGIIEVGERPRSIAVTPDGATLFVTAENSGTIAVVDAKTNTVATTIRLPKPDAAQVPPRPMGSVLSPDGAQLFVSNGRARTVSVIDVASRTLSRTLADDGPRPWGIGLSADGTKLYTANGPSGDVSLIDVASGNVVHRINLGGSPWGIAVASAP
jgi:YVTN family beta-propeller protein